jgi:hypothetical protein
MFFSDYFSRDSEFFLASNIIADGDDLIVLFTDSKLSKADGDPFLPVYHAIGPDGREVLRLSGYD